MRKNPFTKIEHVVAKKVYSNKATIHFNIKGQNYDASTGDLVSLDYVIDRKVFVGRMKKVSDYLVNGTTILSGDLTAKLPITLLKKNLKYMAGDSEIIINGEKKTIADFRTYDDNGGIQTEHDTITILGHTYQFVKIEPTHVYADEPSYLSIILRKI